jgi:monoamine oxidase
MPMGSAVKAIALYDRPFWREAGWSGEVAATAGPVNLVFDDTGPDAEGPAALLAFQLGDRARAAAERSPEANRQAVLEALAGWFGAPALEPMGWVTRDWSAEAWSRGCYVGLMPPGVLTRYARHLAEPFGRVHWAGTETADRWHGYIDGAIASGDRVANEVVRA